MQNCTNCPLKDQPTVQGYGPKDSNIAFVGQAPAAHEVKRGKPFVGKSGKLLRAVWQELGNDLDDSYTTNSTLCKLPYDCNETPYKACQERLWSEIREVSPELIVCLGTDAWKTVMDTERGVMSVRGRWFWHSQLECVVLPTMHPAACLHDPTAEAAAFRDLAFDLEKVENRSISGGFCFEDIDLATDPDCRHDPDVTQSLVISTPDDAKDFYRYIVDSSMDQLTADIETTGLNPQEEEITCIGVCPKPGMTYILTPEAIQPSVLSAFLTYEDLDFIWHNGKFDVRFLRQKGINARVDEDTMLMSYMLDERSGVHSLEYLAGQYFNAPKWEDEFKDEFVEDGDYGAVRGEVLYEYNSLDVHYTYRLFQKMDEKLSGQLRNAYRQVLIPASNALADVENSGMNMDVGHLERVEVEYTEQLEELKASLTRATKKHGWSTEQYVKETGAKSEPEELNLNSDQQMWHVFFDLLDFPMYRGERSIRKEARNWMRETIKDEEKIEFLDLYTEYKELRHSFDLYVKGLRRYQDEDGRVRTDYGLHRTCTGRLSSTSPNLQNISRDKQIKNAFVAEEGNVLVEADYSQAELRALAVLSGDDFLKQVYREGGDLHDSMSEKLWGEGFSKEQRAITKTVQFGVAYGATAHRVANETGWSEDRAQDLIDQWYTNAPGAKEYFEEVERKALNDEPIYSVTGRTRRFPLIKRDNKQNIKREARNFPIQSAASDITLLSGIQLSKRYNVVNLVHDSVIIEIDKEHWYEAAEACKDIMPKVAQDVFETDIPFKVDVEVGQRWGDLEEIELAVCDTD